jgi:galactoside O-acetyltransferase
MPESTARHRRKVAPRPIRRALELPFRRGRILKYRLLSDCHNLHGRPRLVQPTLFSGAGEIVIGEGVTFGWGMGPDVHSGYGYFEARRPQARIEIADDVYFHNSVSVVCEKTRISIGARSLIGFYTYILDTDGHGLEGVHDRLSAAGLADPVEISENVFIGSHVLIFKGVTIGRNSVIGTGSVVTSSIPEDVLAAGNPARVIRPLRDAEV